MELFEDVPVRGPVWIGIDNGVSGSIGLLGDGEPRFYRADKDYTLNEQNYTKARKKVNRVSFQLLKALLQCAKGRPGTQVVLERPMVNPGRFQATMSAIRAMEATLIVVQDDLQLPLLFVDSKEWQRDMLPKGTSGEELKVASRDIGIRLFPSLKEVILKQKDADGLLMAEWCRRRYR